MITWSTVFIFSVLGAQGKVADDANQDLSTWNGVRTSPFAGWFQPGSHVRLPYDCQWDVQLRDGRAFARLSSRSSAQAVSDSGPPFELKEDFTTKGMKGDILYSEVDDGWIVAFDGGEWGSGLWWFSPDGVDKRMISEDSIGGFFRAGVGLIALAKNLMIPSSGYLVRIFKEDSKHWRSERYVDLGGDYADAAFKESANSLLVLASTRLLRVDLEKRVIAEITHDDHWRPMQARTMVVERDGTVVIGMIGCVVKVHRTPKGSTVEWLTPKVALKGCEDPKP